jgi:GNAT superfamily N-acetyltransferase
VRGTAKKSTALRVGGTTIRLPGKDGLEVCPAITHTCQQRYAGFADVESLASEGISHEIAVLVTKDELADALHDRHRSRDDSDRAWAALEPYVAEHGRTSYERGELTIARMNVEEFPVARQRDLREGWFYWLDAIDGDTAVAGEVADRLVDDEGTFALLDGSLFYIRGVSVHPAFQGQQIGARLVAHGLWALHRSTGDVAILLAKPSKNAFTGEESRCGVRDIRRLARYYERMGFERSAPEERIRAGEPVTMHLLLGEFRLPFQSLGTMGID